MAQTLEALGASADRILISASEPMPSCSTAVFRLRQPDLPGGAFCGQEGPLHTIRAFSAQPYGQLWMVGEGPLLVEAKELVTAEAGPSDSLSRGVLTGGGGGVDAPGAAVCAALVGGSRWRR